MQDLHGLMARTPSTFLLPLGEVAPDFSLPRPSGEEVSLSDFPHAKGFVVAFICNHCPYVIHLRDALKAMAREYQQQGIIFIGINANDVENYPDDSPKRMDAEAYPFPYLFDEEQEVAKAYKAACTPDFFVLDGERRLRYRGQFDDSRPGNGKPLNGADLRQALDAVLEGREPAEALPSMGCNIKWIAGNEPEYY